MNPTTTPVTKCGREINQETHRAMKYHLSYPSGLRLNASDRRLIETMIARIGNCNSIGFQSGRTKFSMSRISELKSEPEDHYFYATMQRGDSQFDMTIAVESLTD